jgi:hypothetical protein
MNGGIASGPYITESFDRTIRWSNGADIHFQSSEFRYSDTSSADDVLASASNADAIKLVSDQALTMFVDGVGGAGKTDNLLYIIREDDYSRACKIGYTCKPLERLAGLQVGTWRKLKVEALFCPVKADIPKLERSVLLAAERRGLSISGEWISANPREATALILEFARKRGYALCGCDAFLENLGARVRGLRKQQIEFREEIERINTKAA